MRVKLGGKKPRELKIMEKMKAFKNLYYQNNTQFKTCWPVTICTSSKVIQDPKTRSLSLDFDQLSHGNNMDSSFEFAH
jgi:hypothetical protein